METVGIVLSVVLVFGVFYLIGALLKLSDKLIRERDELQRRLNVSERRIDLLETINDGYIQLFKIKNNN